MPDLGDYRMEVLSAYAVSIVLLAALVWLSWRRYAKVRAALAEVEKNG
ncbi:heme exporter protein CcmD [Yoonia sp. GPGPB17]